MYSFETARVTLTTPVSARRLDPNMNRADALSLPCRAHTADHGSTSSPEALKALS